MWAQNTIDQQWESSSFNQISLILPHCSSISFTSNLSNTIELRYITEGEYKNKLVLSTDTKTENLVLTEMFNPIFPSFNDKLSAHKVMASKIELTLPSHLKVTLKAAVAAVLLKGDYHALELELDEGKIKINSDYSAGKINTQSASIELIGKTQKVWANSRSGKIVGKITAKNSANLLLETVNGNILIPSDKN